jgi:parallel beta-helix repeat protein
MKKLIFCTLLMGLCLISLQSIDAATIAVHPGGSIQKAVNHASNGDTIVVYDKNKKAYTYKESIVINKKVNIIASGHVTIQAKNSRSSVFTVNQLGSGSSIKKFRLINSNYCIMINGAKNTVISGNSLSASLVGIQFKGNIYKNKVLGNKIYGTNRNNGNGISFQYGDCSYTTTYNTVTGNTIKNFLNGILFNAKSEHNLVNKNKVICSYMHGAGIYATQKSKYMQIIGNTVTGAEDGIAVQKLGSGIASNYKISGNTVKNNKNGFWIRLSYSTISSNLAVHNKISGMDITGSHNTISSNSANSNGVCGICLGRLGSKDYNVVSKNKLTYNRAGINSDSTYTKIINNLVRYNTQNGIISTADHTTITGNTILNNPSRIITTGRYNYVHN